ncbi:MAG: hypothetical protein ACJ767_00280, partial [Chloroflexota bacterium]
TAGWNVHTRAMMLTSLGAACVPVEICGVGGAGPASHEATARPEPTMSAAASVMDERRNGTAGV